MPKRKKDAGADYEHLLNKLQKLDKKIRRRCSSRSRSPSRDKHYRSESQERDNSYQNSAHDVDDSNRVAGLLDGNDNVSDDRIHIELTSAPTSELVAELPVANSAADVTSAEDHSLPGTSAGIGDTENNILSDAILQLLGDDPTISSTYGTEIHKDLAVRLEHTATHGLSREVRKELSDTYLLPSNCKLIDAPALNAEMKAAISEMIAKRDKNIEFRQKQNATAISGLSQAINLMFSNKESDPTIIKMLMDAARILCDLQHHDSTVRRSFILTSVKKDMKDQLQNTKPDTMLFGQDLGETLKAAKAINKSSADLKVPVPKPPQPSNKKPLGATTSSKPLNWKGPYPPRKQPPYQNYPRAKDPPPPQNRSRPYNSSRPSQQHQSRGRR